jgi:hypothetical protein
LRQRRRWLSLPLLISTYLTAGKADKPCLRQGTFGPFPVQSTRMDSKKGLSLRLVSLFLLVGLLAACGRQADPPPTNTVEAAALATATATMMPPVQATAVTAAPTPTPSPTATPSPTPIPASLVVLDQTLTDDGQIIVAELIAPAAGWLVVRPDGSDDGVVLGVTAVPAGRSADISLQIDPMAAVPELQAIFHLDHGQSGVFEYPGPDIAWQNEQGEALALSFTVELAVTWPALIVADQDVGNDGLVTVRSVTNPAPAWLRLYTDAAGEGERLLGSRFLEAGEHEDITFFIDWRQATPRLQLRLYEDQGRAGRFDPEVDLPLLAQGQPVAAPFTVYLPPDVFVLDQPLVNDAITVERAISYGPGWVVVYRDEDGEPDLIIGRAPLADGVNRQIVVPLLATAVTPLLHIRLHEDTGEIGLFEFPRADPQLRYEGRLPDPFSFRLDRGSYLLADDPAEWVDGRFSLPLVVAEADLWLVIRANEDGEPGEPLAHLWLTQGIHRQIAIELALPDRPLILHAVLHQDAGAAEEFEYPDGPDSPLTRGRGRVAVSFTVE